MLFEVTCETKQKVTSSLLSKGDRHEYSARANCFSFMQRIQSNFEFKPGFHASLIQAIMKLSLNCFGFTEFKYMRSTTAFKGSSRFESAAQACTATATSCFLSSPLRYDCRLRRRANPARAALEEGSQGWLHVSLATGARLWTQRSLARDVGSPIS